MIIRSLALLAFTAANFDGAAAAACTEKCSTEFVGNCFPFQCEKFNNDAAAAKQQCRSELDNGSGPLAGSCTPLCDDTPEMAALSSCSGSSTPPTAPTSSAAPTAPTPAAPPAPPSTAAQCNAAVNEKPTVPTLCSSDNQGCCECGSASTGIKTYVFWLPSPYDKIQRCVHIYNAGAGATKKPVLLSVSGYNQGQPPKSARSAADTYGFAVIGLGSTTKEGAGGFGLAFGNNGLSNNADPMPCSATDSHDIHYIEMVLTMIADNTALDADRVFAEGFSQNSMWAAYMTVCFADRLVGMWQGGSGLAKTGYTPVVPGKQAQCLLSDLLEDANCCQNEKFCSDCVYWPLYPRTCKHKVRDCIMAYTDDRIACGSDLYMFDAMVAEGNDARLLSFTPTDTTGSHSNPANAYSWITGCLGIVDTCSTACETSFQECVASAPQGATGEAFASCEGDLHSGSLKNCLPGCAPSFGMLSLSEEPVAAFSQGTFGTRTNLPVTSLANRPLCLSPFGAFYDNTVGNQCQAPANWAPPSGTKGMAECGVTVPPTPPTPPAAVTSAPTRWPSAPTPPGDTDAPTAAPSDGPTGAPSVPTPATGTTTMAPTVEKLSIGTAPQATALAVLMGASVAALNLVFCM